MTAIAQLLVEYLVDPIGVDADSPRLSWPTRAAAPVDVTVRRGDAIVWEGKADAGTNQIDLPSRIFAPLTRYRCVVGDLARGEFVTGLRAGGQWTAPWIVASDSDDAAVELSGLAEIGSVGTYWLAVTALGVVRPFVNGRRVGDDELTPGWTDYTRRVRYRLYDVSSLIVAGVNELAMWLAPGWYAGHVGGFGAHRYGAVPSVSAQLLTVGERGGVHAVGGTGADWTVRDLGRPRADLIMGETVTAPVPDGSRRGTVVEVERPPIMVEADSLPPVRAIDEVAAAAVTAPAPGVLVFDFGRVVTGHVRAQVDGPGRVALVHGEELTTAGRVYTDNLRSAEQRDEFVMGAGSHRVEPAFTVHGFRYVEATGDVGGLDRDDVRAIVLATDLRATGDLVASDPAVRQLVANVRSSAVGNAVSIPTDCPQRDERLGWTADIAVFAPTLAFFVDAAAFLGGWVTALIDGQRADGAVPHVAPVVPEYGYDAPVWGDAIVEVPWLLWKRYGDERTLRQAFGPMRRWLDYCLGQCDDGIRPPRAFGDWLAPGVVETPPELIGTAALAHSLQLAARAGRVLGESSSELDDAAANVRSAFRREFLDRGRLGTETQTGYSIALAWDLVALEDRPAALAALVELVERDGHRLTTGFVGTPLLLPVLSSGGRHDVAARIFNQEGYPSWRYQLRAGATTMWERWDSWHHRRGLQTPTMNSFNHYAYGCVGEWLVRHVAGVGDDPDSDTGGFGQIRLRPQPVPLLRQLHARYASPSGVVESGWRVEHDVTQFVATVPAGVEATLRLPLGGAWTSATVNGSFLLGHGDTMPLTRHADGSGELQLPPGRWSFTATTDPALLDPWDDL